MILSLAGCSGSALGLPAAPVPTTAFFPPAAVNASFVVLHRFSTRKQGNVPESIAILPDGSILGSTHQGGSGCASGNRIPGCGVIFELVRTATGYRERMIHRFSVDENGAAPNGLTAYGSGIFYGSTQLTWPSGCGTAFAVVKTLRKYIVQTIHFFGGAAAAPCAPGTAPLVGSDGSIYGTTKGGGIAGYGTVYELTPTRKGWIERTLHSFLGGRDGEVPDLLFRDRRGNFYGQAAQGSGYQSSVVFELIKHGNTYAYRVVRSFPGQVLSNGLFLGTDGRLYGTIGFSKALPCGAVFSIDATAGDAYRELYRFPGGRAGCLPSNIMPLAGGALIGTANVGGASGTHCLNGGCGIVFELLPQGSEYRLVVLHAFRGNDGEYPFLSAAVGNALYGTTNAGGDFDCLGSQHQGCGTVFRLNLPS